VTQIEVSIVCMKRWVSTRYVPMLETLELELQKYGKIEDLQVQVVDSVLYLFLSIGMLYYQEGCNISSKQDQKCSLVDLSEN
jgi:hypothetical protein